MLWSCTLRRPFWNDEAKVFVSTHAGAHARASALRIRYDFCLQAELQVFASERIGMNRSPQVEQARVSLVVDSIFTRNAFARRVGGFQTHGGRIGPSPFCSGRCQCFPESEALFALC
jgi:hypothetical protein